MLKGALGSAKGGDKGKSKMLTSVWRQKGLTGYCFKYTDRPFCLRTDALELSILIKQTFCSQGPSALTV